MFNPSKVTKQCQFVLCILIIVGYYNILSLCDFFVLKVNSKYCPNSNASECVYVVQEVTRHNHTFEKVETLFYVGKGRTMGKLQTPARCDSERGYHRLLQSELTPTGISEPVCE